jgi:predicted alpha-1,2-mannosidase
LSSPTFSQFQGLLAAGLFIFFAPRAEAQMVDKAADPVEWVNPLMGTASKPEMSNGNTYPTIAVPWGMNFWTPQTGKMGNGWAYTYDADKIRGFKQTHQPSPWMNDYGQFALMPVVGAKRFTQDERASWFSHKAETAKPYYYSVYLADADVTAEIAPTERAAQFRITFPKSDSAYIVVDAFDKGSYIKILPDQRKVVGYSTRYARGPLPKNFRNYFVMVFDKPFTSTDTWQGDTLAEGKLEMDGAHSGAILGFRTGKGEQVHVRVASSFISQEQAELNLQRELASDSFEQTRARRKRRGTRCWAACGRKAAASTRCAPSIPACTAWCCSRTSCTSWMPKAGRCTGALTTAKPCPAICSRAPVSGIPSARSILS